MNLGNSTVGAGKPVRGLGDDVPTSCQEQHAAHHHTCN